jgi:hypothetical protein
MYVSTSRKTSIYEKPPFWGKAKLWVTGGENSQGGGQIGQGAQVLAADFVAIVVAIGIVGTIRKYPKILDPVSSPSTPEKQRGTKL